MKLLEKFVLYDNKIDNFSYLLFIMSLFCGLIIFISILFVVYAIVIGSYVLALLSVLFVFASGIAMFLILKIIGLIAVSSTVRYNTNKAIKAFKK